MEIKLKKIKKENKIKEMKIQSLMNELSICKESKTKYIEKNDNDYQVIDDINPATTVEAQGITSPRGIASPRGIVSPQGIASEKASYQASMLPPDDILGECKKSDIKRVFHNLKPYFIKCFEVNKIKRGFIKYSWIINENGDVTKVNLIKNNIYKKSLLQCLSSIIRKGRYNSPVSGVCTVTYVFKL